MRTLADIRVVALEQAVAGPLCSRHLADLGAEVVKIEHPATGDLARHYDHVVHGESAYFVWLNRGKRSVAVDLRTDDGRETFDRLLATADVLVHNLGPGALDRLGYGTQELGRRWPRLIGCAITGYGDGGPYGHEKAFDLMLQGESGLLAITGSADSPARVGISIADISAGVYAVIAVLAALRERDATGKGQHVSIAMLDCMAEWMSVPALYQIYGGRAPERTGVHHATIAPYGPYATNDGQAVILGIQTDGQWRRFCSDVLHDRALADDPAMASNPGRVNTRDQVDTKIDAVFSQLSREEILGRLKAADIPHARMNDVSDLVVHPQLSARDRWGEADSPSGPVRFFVPPFSKGPEPGRIPGLGSDTDEVIGELVDVD